ncbi:hypothetical protein MSAR_24640 [Mycolicibacterium sarraceniae]|uniref:Glycosyl transferase n=1 Tax=Mycolicibacterium sarraceniae TaxID=1534348 RepID=A0A7I7SR96_9MYCO|nr:hypothetical protein MSAR_24640 [Mycolicibacterium sarraceniae]
MPANDELAFAQAISDLLDEPARRTTMGLLGRARLEKQLSWEFSRQELVEFYHRMIPTAGS